MGYRGKLSQRQQAHQLRRAGLPLAEIDRLVEEGRERIGRLSEREFLVAGVALYAGEGTKRDGAVRFANSDPRMIFFFFFFFCCCCCWLRRLMRSTSPACGCVSTFTRVSTWQPRSLTGRR